jgi:hypothetical protein
MRTRYGVWTQTVPFSVNAIDSQWAESDFLETTQINIVPTIFEFEPSGTDPTGSRHLTTHPSFVQVLASGQGAATLTFPKLDLRSTSIGTGSGISATRCIIFRIAEFEHSTSRISDVKMWLSDTSDFLVPETSQLIFRTFNTWVSGFAFNDPGEMLNSARHVPESLPDVPNIVRQDGGNTMYETGDDHVSEFIYIAFAASGTTPLGEYGSDLDGPTGFNLRFTYNIDNLPLRD